MQTKLLPDLFQPERRPPPGAAACVFSSSAISVETVHGCRDSRNPAPVEAGDLWHFGSAGKPMTASMITALAATGAIRLDDRLDAAVPEAANTAFAGVTLRELLAHRSGLPTNPSQLRMILYIALGGDAARASARMVESALKRAPAFAPGTDFLYSNVGYGFAGLIASRRTGLSFEDLIRHHVTTPLSLRSLNFGLPPQDGTAPREHMARLRGKGWKRVTHGVRVVDDIPVLRPSGCLHGTVPDLAAFGQAHLRAATGLGERGAEHLSMTHAPCGPPPEEGKRWRYGLGWLSDETAEAGPRLWHAGSTGGCFALLLLLPRENLGIALTANAFDPDWAMPESSMMARITSALLERPIET